MAGIIDYIPATFTNSDTPSTNNAFLLKATFSHSSRIAFYSSIVLNQTIRDRVEHQKTIPSSSWVRPFMSLHYFFQLMMFGLFCIMLKDICWSPSPPFLKSLTQTFWFYRSYINLTPLAFKHIACISITDATSTLRLLPSMYISSYHPLYIRDLPYL